MVILINSLTLLILSTDKIPTDSLKMYLFLKTHIFFNMIFIFIKPFGLIAYCIEEGLFCSYVRRSIVAQWFVIIVVRLLSKIFQSISNIAMVSFCLSRYIIITNTNRYNSINNISLKLYIFLTFLFSLFINIFIVFEFTIRGDNGVLNQLKPFDIINFNNYKEDLIDDFKENYTKTEYTVLQIFQYVKIIFSDAFYIIISFIIDLILLKFLKKKIEQKKKLLFYPVIFNTVNQVATIMVDQILERNQIRIKRFDSTKKRMTSMIILNGINFIFFRLPLSLLSFYGFIYRFDKNSNFYKPSLISYIICRAFKLCSALDDLFYFVYLISFVVQYTILYKLDKNFKESFKHLKNNFFSIAFHVTRSN